MSSSVRRFRAFRKAVNVASTASAPRVGVTIAAAPAITPAIIGHRDDPRAWPMFTRPAQTAAIENKVVNQWWLTWVHMPCDIATHPIARTAESDAFLLACRQARKVQPVIRTIVRTASIRADKSEMPAILNHAAVMTNPPGGKNSKKSA